MPVDPLWAALTVNMVVLAPEYTDQGTPEGWWEAVIVAIHGDVMTLRFRDYPRQSLKRRKRDEIAIMYPRRCGFDELGRPPGRPSFLSRRRQLTPTGPASPCKRWQYDHQNRAHSRAE
jgi:hypothetical protein